MTIGCDSDCHFSLSGLGLPVTPSVSSVRGASGESGLLARRPPPFVRWGLLGRHSFKEFPSLVPHTNIQSTHSMKDRCPVEINPSRKTAAIGNPAQRRRPVMDAAASLIQIHTLGVRLVGDHQGSRNIRMRFSLIAHCQVFWLESYSIALTAQCASVTGNLPRR